jgi:4-hydroxy-tetrahydrodipicolinate synthase
MQLTGSIVALVTPMEADGEIDWMAWDALIDWHLQEGTDGLVVVGTTGESATVSVEESVELVAKAMERVKGRIPVIAGAGTHSTHGTIERARALAETGCDALLLVTPYYNKPPQAGLIKHFLTIADSVSTPLILYNVPGRTGVDMLPETTAKLAAHPRIIAIKEAVPGAERVREIKALAPTFTVISGDDPTLVEALAAGAVGIISVSANVMPKRMHALVTAALNGDWAGAKELDASLRELHGALFVEPNPIPAKWALHRMGKMEAGIRLPLLPLSDAAKPSLTRTLESLGVL